MEWENVAVPSGGTREFTLALVAGSGVRQGAYVNRAFVEAASTDLVISNVAEARIRVTPDEVFDCAEVIGKVFDDIDRDGIQDKGEKGIAGARLATVNGLLMTTDEFGRYHIACAATPKPGIGSNFILKLDDRTLPTGHFVSSENPRVIRLTEGKLSQLNFGVARLRRIELQFSSTAFGDRGMITDEFRDKLSETVSAMKAVKSTVRLVYISESNDADRLRRVDTKLRSLWEVEGAPYELTVERVLMQ